MASCSKAKLRLRPGPDLRRSRQPPTGRCRPAHRVQHRLRAVKAHLGQEHRGHGLAHGGLGDGDLVAALVQRFAGRIDAEGDQIILDPGLDGHRRIGGDGRTQFLGDGPLDPLRRGPGVIDLRGLADRLDLDRLIWAQDVGPGNLRARLSSCARCMARNPPMRARTRVAPRSIRLARRTSDQSPVTVTPPGWITGCQPKAAASAAKGASSPGVATRKISK